MIAYEKAHMLPLNFMMSYVLIPAYVVLAILLISFLGSQLNSGNIPMSLTSLILLLALTAALLMAVPAVRKRAIRSELKRYDLDASKEESREVWDFSEKELSVRFDQFGMRVNGRLYYYNHLHKLLMTDNASQRVTIYLVFAPTDNEGLMIPLDPRSLRMLSDFGITLDNQKVLDHILDHKHEAFTEIYKKGEISAESLILSIH